MRNIGSLIIALAMVYISTGCHKENTSSKEPSSKQTNEADLQEQQKLQGTWQVVGIVAGGKSVAEEKVKGIDLKYVFSGDKMTKKRKNEADEPGTYEVNPSSSPKQMDLHLSNGTIVKAIYDHQGDTLKLCLNVDSKSPAIYPSEMGSKASPSTDLLTLKRVNAP